MHPACILLVLCACTTLLGAEKMSFEPLTSPEEAMKAIRVTAGFKLELVASEPLVKDPIAIAWGADGKLWVVEMGDYPLGSDGKGGPDGRVKYLEDTDGDGRYDKATLFLDGLSYPTGVMPWGKGVLVTCAPDLFYAEATGGEGKADEKVVLFTGFGQGNQQHLVNGLRWGLDNWVYGANGDGGAGANGVITSVRTGKETDIRGRDFRIRPGDGINLTNGDEVDFDATSGPTQFGRYRDDWGNWFGSNNAQPMYHFVLDERYLRRNTHLPSPDPRVHIVPISNVPLFQISQPLAIRGVQTEITGPVGFASACSAAVYRDDLFGPNSTANAFICDPATNLVHREILQPAGLSFTSHRPAEEPDSEFFASSDGWCRPTMAVTGPDGAVYVVDMYRLVIEHPEWIDANIKAQLDLRAGRDLGRIYRIYPEGAEPRPIPRLEKLDAPGLVAALDTPSGWQRDMAHQLLFERQDKAAVPLLEKVAAEGINPLARLHALCALDGMKALTPEILQKAAGDSHPGVRRHVPRLCEPLLKQNKAIGEVVARLAEDPEPQVRLHAACTLGEWDHPRAASALASLALRDAADPFILEPLLTAVLKQSESDPPATLLGNLLRIANGQGNGRVLATLISNFTKSADGKYTAPQFTAVAELMDSADAANAPLTDLLNAGDDAVQVGLARLSVLLDAARAVVGNAEAPEADRVAALALLGREPGSEKQDAQLLAKLLVPQSPEPIQAAAIAALGRVQDPDAMQRILAGWGGYGPALRAHALDVILSRKEGAGAVMDAIEAGKIRPAEVDATRRQRLLTDEAPELAARAAKVFAELVNPDRQKVIEAYAATLTLTGDARHGQELFTKTCAACHRVGDQGNAVGPDLAAVADKTPEGLMIAILDPNRAVEAKYVNYVAETKDRKTISGVIASESGASVKLLAADGKAYPILRSDLRSLRSSSLSLMPEGLEAGMSPQDLADLIEFVGAR